MPRIAEREYDSGRGGSRVTDDESGMSPAGDHDVLLILIIFSTAD